MQMWHLPSLPHNLLLSFCIFATYLDTLREEVTGADPGFFFRRGCTRLLLYFNTNKPHSFFCRIPVVLENRRSSQKGGVRTPCTLPLDPPLC